jgi:transcriptional regulator with XRE-family HTH domain
MEQVRILREARGWTQQHLADAADLSLRTVQRVEAGEVSASKETLLALSGAFNVKLDSDDGPHVVLTRDDPPFLPGCRLTIYKDGYQVPCVIGLDSRARTVTRFGMLLLDFSDEELGNLVVTHPPDYEGYRAPTEWAPPISDASLFIVNGEPWDGRDNPVTFIYDAVVLSGPSEALDKARWVDAKVPKHWILYSTDGSTPRTTDPDS